MVGGPSETHPWPQIVCNVLGLTLDTVYGPCAGAVGAAILVGIGAGLYADVYEAQKQLSPERISRIPESKLHDFYKNLYIKFRERFPYV